MDGTEPQSTLAGALSASWERCERQYKLVRDAPRPILRLQSTEVAPRLEEMVERTGGRQGIIRQLAGFAAETGSCLVLTDTDGVLVRLEGREDGRRIFEANGIALGSCWDERIAGTNGISMALSQGRACTVSGKDHYFSRLRPFSCTAEPLFDAENRIIGALNLAMIDRGNVADYRFARQLLGAAADRIQRILFERRFADAAILSVAPAQNRDLLRSGELVAVNDAGIILGTTAGAHLLAGESAPARLKGKAFEMMFGADVPPLQGAPDRVVSIRSAQGASLTIAARVPAPGARRVPGWRPAARDPGNPVRRRLAPSLRQLATGSEGMAAACARAQAHFRRGLPFVIEGESGTGKSGLVAALVQADGLPSAQVLTIDCALLGDTEDDRRYIRTIFEQARVAGSLDPDETGPFTIAFENVNELPAFAQAGLRQVLAEFEQIDRPGTTATRVLATSRGALRQAVADGRFRDDLFYLLATMTVVLPPLRVRERADLLARDLADELAGAQVEIAPEAVQDIAGHGWPGNVRELRNTLQQALIEGDGRRISRVDLHLTSAGIDSAPAPAGARPDTRVHRYDERRMILDALTGTRWNVSQAARNLGMGRATIHRKMKKLGLARP